MHPVTANVNKVKRKLRRDLKQITSHSHFVNIHNKARITFLLNRGARVFCDKMHESDIAS